MNILCINVINEKTVLDEEIISFRRGSDDYLSSEGSGNVNINYAENRRFSRGISQFPDSIAKQEQQKNEIGYQPNQSESGTASSQGSATASTATAIFRSLNFITN